MKPNGQLDIFGLYSKASTFKLIVVQGLIAGFVSYLIASILTAPCKNLQEHDHHLAAIVGLLYAVLAAYWLPQSQNTSKKSSLKRVLTGILFGGVYAFLSEFFRNYGLTMILFPSLIIATSYVALNISDNSQISMVRKLRACADGLIAGASLALIHTLLLSSGLLVLSYFGFIYFQDISASRYIQAVSVIGTCSFSLASCFFFILITKLSNEPVPPLKSSFTKELVRIFIVLLAVTCLSNGDKFWKPLNKQILQLFTSSPHDKKRKLS